MIWLLYGNLWVYTNGIVPGLFILCMCLYVAHSLILPRLYTPRIFAWTLYTTDNTVYTPWDVYLFYVCLKCVLYCFIYRSVFVSNDKINVFRRVKAVIVDIMAFVGSVTKMSRVFDEMAMINSMRNWHLWKKIIHQSAIIVTIVHCFRWRRLSQNDDLFYHWF